MSFISVAGLSISSRCLKAASFFLWLFIVGMEDGDVIKDGRGSFFENCVAYVVYVGLTAHCDRFSFIFMEEDLGFQGAISRT